MTQKHIFGSLKNFQQMDLKTAIFLFKACESKEPIFSLKNHMV